MVAMDPSISYYPPTLYLDTRDFPGIENWKAGQTVHLVVEAEVGSVTVREKPDGKKEYDTSLVVAAIADISDPASKGEK